MGQGYALVVECNDYNLPPRSRGEILATAQTNMTLSIPEELHKKMKRHTELKWSDIARHAFEKKLNEMEFVEKVLKNSELTENDAERIGHEINQGWEKGSLIDEAHCRYNQNHRCSD